MTEIEAKPDPPKVYICANEQCRKPHKGGNKYCIPCRQRWWRYGNPNEPPKCLPKGTALNWIKDHIEYDGEDCLKWPFSIRSHGVGGLKYNGKREFAPRVMLLLKDGPPPSEEYNNALHSCGKGHEGCVNPNHLRWGTLKENSADRLVHKTECRGETHSNATVTEEEVLEMRRRYAEGERICDIVSSMNITYSCGYQAIKRQSWRHI